MTSTAAKPLTSAVDRRASGADVSIVVAAGGEVVYERDSGARRTPASVQKVLLTMALFDTFGPTHRIVTRAVTAGPAKKVVGHLWIVGGGDPTISSGPGDTAPSGVEQLANRIADSGIELIEGRVVADTSRFAPDWDAPGWQRWSRSFVARPTALALDGNTTADPPLAFASALTDALEDRGVEVRDEPAQGRAPAGAPTVAVIRSAPLRTIVGHMNSSSSNFDAEMLGKLLGARTFGAPGTMAKGARAIEGWARRHGVAVTSHDASGLSYANRLSAADLVRLLERARREAWGPALLESLPEPGEGTLAARLTGSPVRAKTGTLWSGDSALAGWVRLPGGGIAEFAVLGRDEPKTMEDAVVRAIEGKLRLAPPRQLLPFRRSEGNR